MVCLWDGQALEQFGQDRVWDGPESVRQVQPGDGQVPAMLLRLVDGGLQEEGVFLDASDSRQKALLFRREPVVACRYLCYSCSQDPRVKLV